MSQNPATTNNTLPADVQSSTDHCSNNKINKDVNNFNSTNNDTIKILSKEKFKILCAKNKTNIIKGADISLLRKPLPLTETRFCNSVILSKIPYNSKIITRPSEPASITIRKVQTGTSTTPVAKFSELYSIPKAEPQVKYSLQDNSLKKKLKNLSEIKRSILKVQPILQSVKQIKSPRSTRSKSLSCCAVAQNNSREAAKESLERRHSTAERKISTNEERIEKLNKILNINIAKDNDMIELIEYDEDYFKNCDGKTAFTETITNPSNMQRNELLDTLPKEIENCEKDPPRPAPLKRKLSVDSISKSDCIKIEENAPPKKLSKKIFTRTKQSNEQQAATLGITSSLLCNEKMQLKSPSTSNSPPSVIKSSSSLLIGTHKSSMTNTLTATAKSMPPEAGDTSTFSLVLNMMSSFNMLVWKERIGKARGTAIKFELNELNFLQIADPSPIRTAHSTYEKPIYDRVTAPLLHKLKRSDWFLCRYCNCHGTAMDFLAPGFCSLDCLKKDTCEEVKPEVIKKRKDQHKNNMKTKESDPKVNAVNKLEVFRWTTHMKKYHGTQSAPVHLFYNPFPTGPNPFAVGMKLEAIDPENCALFCVCTVIAVLGYRIKLKFDGFDSMYDFWVDADSMDIFPPGWCFRTGRILQPPNGINTKDFNWSVYLAKTKSLPARRHFFTHLNVSRIKHNFFKVGMYLEAEDLNDTGKLCVAMVADVLNDRIRVHFNGWDDCYDYWVDINSPYIHPCGWHEGLQQLIVPPDYEHCSFEWSDYICQQNIMYGTNNIAAPKDIFSIRDPILFKPNMKLEVVDPRNTLLVRPATVIGRKGYRIKVHLDGWPFEYCFWLEDDSPDLHPIGWCAGTGYNLEPPPGYYAEPPQVPCSILGCRGIGNAKRFILQLHASIDCCPYALENWRQKIEKPPRLEGHDIIRQPLPTKKECNVLPSKKEGNAFPLKKEDNAIPTKKECNTVTIKKECNVDIIERECNGQINKPNAKPKIGTVIDIQKQKTELQDDHKLQILKRTQILENNYNNKPRRTRKEKLRKDPNIELPQQIVVVKQEMIEEPMSHDSDENDQKFLLEINCASAANTTSNAVKLNLKKQKQLEPCIEIARKFLCDYGPRLQQNYNIWRKNLTISTTKIKRNPMYWTTAETISFLKRLINSRYTFAAFEHQGIDGTALLLLQQSDLTDQLNMKLGHAVKLSSAILQLRTLAFCKFGLKNKPIK